MEILQAIGKPTRADQVYIDQSLRSWTDADLRAMAQAKKDNDYSAMYQLVISNGLNPENTFVRALHDLHINQQIHDVKAHNTHNPSSIES